jgi:hypothetical protein
MLAPPLEAGAVNATLNCLSPAVIPVIVGAPANAALTLLLAIETVWSLAPVELKVTTWLLYAPTAAFAASRKYKVPFANPSV